MCTENSQKIFILWGWLNLKLPISIPRNLPRSLHPRLSHPSVKTQAYYISSIILLMTRHSNQPHAKKKKSKNKNQLSRTWTEKQKVKTYKKFMAAEKKNEKRFIEERNKPSWAACLFIMFSILKYRIDERWAINHLLYGQVSILQMSILLLKFDFFFILT